MTVTQKVLMVGLTFATTILALLIATLVCGPAVRTVFGVPSGFGEDFTSPAAFLQALLVQAATVGVAFFILGVAFGGMLRTVRYRDAAWVVNPIIVGVGFAAYKAIYHSLHSPDYLAEYDNLRIFAIFCLAAPVVFAGCFYSGLHLRRR